jgi:uncharacterized protein (TIGR00288 family)
VSLFFFRKENRSMKNNTIILVDGENISYRYADKIKKYARRLGTVVEQKVYHRQKDPCTLQWTEKAKANGYKDICLCGGPAKNKVDHKMQKDARAYMQNPEIGIVCIVTSDSGFRCLSKDAAIAGKKLYFIGEEKAPVRLRSAGTKFIMLK